MLLMPSGALDVQLPRVELVEMGPRLDLSVRRRRDAPPDLAKEAHRQPKLTGKKVQMLDVWSAHASAGLLRPSRDSQMCGALAQGWSPNASPMACKHT